MNAYELADGLKKSIFSPKFLDEAETMLRQQADQLIQLKLEWQYMFDKMEQQADRIKELEVYEKQIKQMESAYDAHFKKALGK